MPLYAPPLFGFEFIITFSFQKLSSIIIMLIYLTNRYFHKQIRLDLIFNLLKQF